MKIVAEFTSAIHPHYFSTFTSRILGIWIGGKMCVSIINPVLKSVLGIVYIREITTAIFCCASISHLPCSCSPSVSLRPSLFLFPWNLRLQSPTSLFILLREVWFSLWPATELPSHTLESSCHNQTGLLRSTLGQSIIF